VAGTLELYVLDEGTSRGPMPVEAVRRALGAGEIGQGARFRIAEGLPWLPGAAWDALADLLPAPHPPDPPEGPAAPLLPGELADIPPKVREHLVWFVADEDGVMGPVGGDFVVQGIRAGKISPSAAVSLASWRVRATWVLAPMVFPSASAGATTMRKRAAPASATCAYCLEPHALGAAACPVCGEPTRPAAGPSRGQQALTVLAALGISVVVAAGAVALAWRDPPAARPDAATGAAAAGAPASAAAAPDPAGTTATPDRAGAAPGHLSHIEIASTLALPGEVADVLALSPDRIAVAREASFQILDSRSGAAVLEAPELAGARALHAAHGAGVIVVALGPRAAPAARAPKPAPAGEEPGRLAAVDARTARTLAWIERAASPAPPAIAPARGLVLLPDPARRSALALDAARLAEIARLPLGAPVSLLAVDDRGLVALAAEGDEPEARPAGRAAPAPAPASGGVVFAFSLAPAPASDAPPELPGSGASLRPTRRIQLPERPAALAVSGDGAFGAALLRGRAEILRIDLSPRAALGPPGPRAATCADPAGLFIGAGVVLVTCGDSHAAAIHDAETLALLATLELGGPALAADLAPDRAQALVAVGAPAPGVAVLDLPRREARTLAAGEPVEAVRYGLGGRVATAVASLSSHILVLR